MRRVENDELTRDILREASKASASETEKVFVCWPMAMLSPIEGVKICWVMARMDAALATSASFASLDACTMILKARQKSKL